MSAAPAPGEDPIIAAMQATVTALIAQVAALEARQAQAEARLVDLVPPPLTAADIALQRALMDPDWAELGEPFGARDICDVARTSSALSPLVVSAVGSRSRVQVGLWLGRMSRGPAVDGLRLVRRPDGEHAGRYAYERVIEGRE
jgi:hypothetical protein